jgi:hypothetical protein
MKHDDLCEIRQTQFTPWGIRTAECHCASRAFPLCDGCRSGQHLKHRRSDRDCQCDLCSPEEEVA